MSSILEKTCNVRAGVYVCLRVQSPWYLERGGGTATKRRGVGSKNRGVRPVEQEEEEGEKGAPYTSRIRRRPRRNLAFHLRFPPVLLGRRSCKLHLRPS